MNEPTTEPEIRHWDGPPLSAWQAWHPAELAAKLAGVGVPWAIVGGWAIDLYLGRTTRSHGDIELSIPRAGFDRVRDHLSDFSMHVVGDGEVRVLPSGALPPPERHQNWVLDPVAGRWRADVMLDPGDDEHWVFRRDPRIRARRADVTGVRDGIPFLTPEVVLLFKAKAQRPKDERDFAAVRPSLVRRARRWLIAALHQTHPDHAWIAMLEDSAG